MAQTTGSGDARGCRASRARAEARARHPVALTVCRQRRGSSRLSHKWRPTWPKRALSPIMAKRCAPIVARRALCSMAPRPSRRAAAASEAIVERVVAEHLQPGVTNLAPGTAKWRPPPELMPSHTAEDNFMYGACHGQPSLLDALRTKLATENRVDLTARDVMVTNGANQAYAAALLATCDPGDEVVLFQPYYFSHLVAAQLLGLSVLIEP